MSNAPTQEPSHNEALRRITARLDDVDKRMAVLHMHDADGADYAVPLAERWQPLPGRVGVQVYHVPNPNGASGLHMTAFAVEAGASYSGSRIDESRLLELLDGDLLCNGHPLEAGRFVWLAPLEATNWASTGGAFGVVYYSTPRPETAQHSSSLFTP